MHSYFKDIPADHQWFQEWVSQLEKMNGRRYYKTTIKTSLGKTQIYGVNTTAPDAETMVIFPGARTTSLFWDLDNGLKNLGHVRIYLVETNGLPNLSDGTTPDIKGLGYGEWAKEVFDQLGLKKAFISGASFGGLVCMKMGIVAPERIKAAFLLNPGCLQPFSLSLKNLYYNILPIVSPSGKNVSKFLDKAVLCKPNHQPSAAAEKLLIDYEVFALTRYKDNTQKPYYMGDQLKQVKCDTYLIEGDKDLLFPFAKSISNAKNKISSLKEVKIFENVGHGIETHAAALQYVQQVMTSIAKRTVISNGG